MTVSELIATLQELPADLRVTRADRDGNLTDITAAIIETETLHAPDNDGRDTEQVIFLR